MSQSPTSDPVASASRDHWQVLGLSAGADAASIKRAFRQQARRWHPDLNGNDPVAEARFKEVNEAYAVLSDPVRRRAWEAGDGQDSAGLDSDPFATGFPRFEDYLAQLFGQERRSPREWDEEPIEEEPPPAGEVTTAPASPPPVMAATDE